MKITVTGGHLTPAYAFIEQAQTHDAIIEVIGASGQNSLEATVLRQLHVPYHSILPIKFDRLHKLRSLLKLPLITIAIAQSYTILLHSRPDRVLVFGSFNAVPVAIAAKLLNIPCYLHEQTHVMGLANRLISHFVTGCAVSYSESKRFVRHHNVKVTGNLLRKNIWHPPPKPSFTLPSHKPILYITGGNQGSAAILTATNSIISQLTASYQLIIQHGKVTLPTVDSRILAQSWFDVDDVSWILAHAHIVISRGGANTTAELMAAAAPSIIIPLPHASHQEQIINASFIAKHHAAIVLPQHELTGQTLYAAITQMETDYEAYKRAAQHLKSMQNPAAAEQLYDFIIHHDQNSHAH